MNKKNNVLNIYSEVVISFRLWAIVLFFGMLACAEQAFGSYAYVANSSDGTVSVIHTKSNSVVATIPVGLNPQAVAITLDGNYLYVSNYGSNTISVIDVLSNLVVSAITSDSFNAPSGVAFCKCCCSIVYRR